MNVRGLKKSEPLMGKDSGKAQVGQGNIDEIDVK